MKQTAVEWLIKEFNLENFEATCNFAKEMEKEQIVKAYLKGYLEEIPNPSASHYYEDMAEQYYKETYESNT